jgi:Arc/MetJ-type ribon-helix-helix transcriptional regulator
MSTLGVRIPESQKKKLEEKIEKKGYPNVAEYVRELIRDGLEEEMREEYAKEILRRKKQVEGGEIGLEAMRTFDEIVEDEGIEY